MSLLDLSATLHLSGQPTGEKDRYGNEVIGPPTDQQVDAWWEKNQSTENMDQAAQATLFYWVWLPEDAPVTFLDAITLHGVIDERCTVEGAPMYQPGGTEVPGFIQILAKRVTG